MTKNVLIALWLLFSIAWSAFIAFLLFIVTAVPAHVSGGLSPFFLYWLGPIVVPLVIYKIIKIYGVRTKNTENKEWPVATNNESDENA
jgi:hypothetical protein